MVSLRAFALSTVAIAALTGVANAADLLPPPPAVEPAPPMPMFDAGGWYLRGDVGLGLHNSLSAKTSPNPLDNAADGSTDEWSGTNLSESGLFDVGVGYQFNNWFRADVTGELRGGANFSGLEVVNSPITGPQANSPGYPYQNQFADFYRGSISTTLVMFNGYFDLGTWYGLTPYVGAGIGVAFNRFSGGTDTGTNYSTSPAGSDYTGNNFYNSSSGGILTSGTHTDLAWALMAGTDFNVTKNLKLELGYRYLNYGKFQTGKAQCLAGGGSANLNGLSSFDGSACSGGGYKITSSTLSSNDFRLGLRYYFDAAPPEAPIVRKY